MFFNQSKVISFDIFDTLLVRPYVDPKDLFLHLEKLTDKVGFYEERIAAEKRIRDKKFSQEEITLSDIYQEINPFFRDMMQQELDFEERVLQPHPQMFKFWKKLVKKNKRIIIISDMYLPQEVIERILIKNGYTEYEKLYLSSSCMKTKYSGNLFRYVCEDLNIKPRELYHIGDNKHSDVDIPRSLGIKVHPVEKVIDILFRKKRAFKRYYQPHNLGRSIILGMIATNAYKSGYWVYLGRTFVGPAMIAFSQWLNERVSTDKIKSLLFIGRDGYILKKVFDLICISDCKSVYLYAPRFVNKKNESQYQEYQRYLQNFKLPTTKLAMVDTITVHFSSQKLLMDCLFDNILGYYWAIRAKKQDPVLFNKVKEFSIVKDPFFVQWDLMELFMTAPYPPVIDFKEGEPIFIKTSHWEKKRILACKGIEKGVLDFIEKFLKIFEKKQLFITEKDIRDFVNIIPLKPSKKDKWYLSKIKHAADVCNEQYKPLMSFWQNTNRPSHTIWKVKIKNNTKKYYLFGLRIFTRKIK